MLSTLRSCFPIAASVGLFVLASAPIPPAHAVAPADEFPPSRLADTGLYADAGTHTVAADCLPFAPQYPLWTDGATKRRWVFLPPGTAIDASDPDRWVFPVGTRLWKEFSFGRAVETRLMELTPGGWRFAAYVWNQDGTDAVLAPERGVPGVTEFAPGVGHDIPGRTDCLACHDAGRATVLGFDALQLSADLDPASPHGGRPPGSLDLDVLRDRGLLVGWPVDAPAAPRIAAGGPSARPVLGYLHGNCAACHNGEGPLAMLGLDFEFRVAAAPATPAWAGAGFPKRDELLRRASTRNPYVQMPPLGTHLVDEEAIALVETWIREETPPEAIAPAHTDPPGGRE